MKYCRSCKIRAADNDTVCSKCGQPLAVLGAPQPGDPQQPGQADAPAFTLQGQIRQLEAAQKRNVKSAALFGLLALVMLGGLLLTGVIVYYRTVLTYAVLSNVQIEQDPRSDTSIRVSFNVEKPGKISYDRRSGGEHTEKLDVFSEPGRKELTWTWPSSASTGIDFSVQFRGGLTRSSVQRHFDVSGKTTTTGMVDVVFLLDTTASMEPFIKGLKDKCIEFAEVVRREGVDCRLGLIAFGDVDIGEPMRVFDPTDELQLFQTTVSNAPRNKGGDDPESSVEALQRALKIQFRTGAAVCFVHITDADCHNPQELVPLAMELKEREIIVYAVSQTKFSDRYKPICVNGGQFYSIESARFDDILLNVARAITSQIGYK